jgi:hypothetical protein
MEDKNGSGREEIELADGDTLAERLETVDLHGDETCSTDELRERLENMRENEFGSPTPEEILKENQTADEL